MSSRSFTSKATTTIGLVIVLLFLAAVPIVFMVERKHSQEDALAALDAFGRTVAADQQRRFTKVAIVEREAIANMRRLLAAPRPGADAALDADFPLAGDGTRRSRDALFTGEVRPDGSIVSGIGGFIPNADAMPAERVRTVIAAFDALRASSGGILPELSSLYFFTPHNDVVIRAPTRVDKLLFYRKKAPASLDFQRSSVAEIMTVANNPRRELRCTGLEQVTFDPTGKTWTTGCMTPLDVDGRYIGSWGVSLLLNELFADGIPAGPPDATTVIVSNTGHLIYHPTITRQSDRETGAHLDLTKTTDPQMRALWQFVQAHPGAAHFQGEVPALGAYVALNTIPTPGWRVVTFLPRSIVLAQSMRSAATIVIVGLVAMAATITLLWFFIRRTVGKPLLALATRAEAIAAASGRAIMTLDIDQAVPAEIARLGASFDMMEDAVDAERKRMTRSFDLLAKTVEDHAIYMLDSGGHFINWNRGAERMTGFTAAEALGRTVSLLVPDDDGIDADASPTALQALARANGRAMAEGWRWHRDGSRFWASIVTEAIIDPRGEFVGFAEIMRDVSEDRRRRLKLEESVRLLNLAEDLAEIGHWRMWIGKNEVEWSPGTYRIHGVPLGTPVTVDFVMSHYAGRDRSQVEAAIAELVKDGKATTVNTEILRGDGERRLVTIESLPEYDTTGALESIFGVMRDVTAETEINRQLTEARENADAAAQDRAELLATMSHEIRTPMTAIIGMLDVLQHAGGTLPRSISLGGIAQSARTLMVVLDDVLEHSRLESGAVQIETLPFDLGDLIEQTAQLFRPLAGSKGYPIVVEGTGLGWVAGDPTRVQQIISNLIGNAVKFTSAGEVRVRGRRLAGDRVRIEVEDTGIGIAPEVLPTLFHAFRQAEPGTVRTHGGSGLGLSISRRLAEIMGGTIGASSTVGTGSCFWVELTLPETEHVLASETRPQSLLTRTGDSPTILVVEDGEATRLVVEAQLRGLGCRAVSVGDGVAALAQLFAGDFDAVLMDSHMPILDGAGTIRLARLLPPPQGLVPLISFTAGAATEAQSLRDAGADDVLPKPFDRKRLTEKLQMVLMRPAPASEADPSAALVAVFDSLPAVARSRIAVSATADLARHTTALSEAIDQGEAGRARAALHALAGLAHTLGDTALAARCTFGEALLNVVDASHCGWLAAAVARETERTQHRVAAAAPGTEGATA